jgi:hypothetical protein
MAASSTESRTKHFTSPQLAQIALNEIKKLENEMLINQPVLKMTVDDAKIS